MAEVTLLRMRERSGLQRTSTPSDRHLEFCRLTGIIQACHDLFVCQIRKFPDDLFMGRPGRQVAEHEVNRKSQISYPKSHIPHPFHCPLDKTRGFSYKLTDKRFGIRVLARRAIKGKPVKFRYGPAAVIGDECRTKPLSIANWAGRRGMQDDPRVRRPNIRGAHQGRW